METLTSVSEMEHFRFGSKIICSDGEDGVLTHVGFNGSNRRLVSIGIKLGRLFGKTVYIPFSSIADARGNSITLKITRAELAASIETLTGQPLDAKGSVVNVDTSARGSLRSVAVQPGTGEFAYLVAHHLRNGQDTLVPVEYLSKIEAGQITVSIPDAIFQTLPPYRSDEDLQQEVEEIIYSYGPLHVDMDGITLRVVDAVLYIEGNISSSLRGDIVEDQVAGVQGLIEVKNLLVGDDQLAADLGLALSRDPRTNSASIGIYPRLGDVRLSGYVRDDQQKSAAESIAKGFSGVHSVSNELVVNTKSDALGVMAAANSSSSEDLVPGTYVRHTK